MPRGAQILEPGDVEEALHAATAIGDDRLQLEAQGYVVPDSFTHGTSAQRVRWFQARLQQRPGFGLQYAVGELALINLSPRAGRGRRAPLA